MSKLIKTATNLGAVILLATSSISGATPANAAGIGGVAPTLSYDAFKASQGYQELLALGALSKTAYEAMPGIEMVSTIHATITVDATLDMTINVKTNKTDSTSTTTVAPSQGLIAGTTNYYFSNGHYLFDAQTYESATQGTGTNNLAATLKRLGAPKNALISTKLKTPLGSVADISPAAFASSPSQDGLSSLTASPLEMLFTPVVCAAPAEAPTTRVCTYRASVTTAALDAQATVFVDASLTFDSTGLMSKMSIVETSDPSGLDITINTTMTPLTGWSLTLPKAVVTDTKVIAMGRQINSETIATSQINKVVTKAKALAKKAKTPLTPALLVQSAKQLKQKVSTLSGGIKVSNKWQGVKGSSCAVVSKGKVTVKRC